MKPGLERRRARAKKEKVADRPHLYTLIVGVLGPIVTALAIGVTGCFAYKSWTTANESLTLAERSMKVGQRAYISIENSGSSISLIRAVRDVAGGGTAPSLGVAIEQSFRMRNSGRTPASLKTLTLKFYTPDGWWIGADSRNRYSRDGRWWIYKQPMGNEIGQESNRTFTNSYGFGLSEHAVRAYQHYLLNKTFPEGDFGTFAEAYPVQVLCTLEFVDVFGDTHTVNWQDQAQQISLRDTAPRRQ
jgi:hypothetical protein